VACLYCTKQQGARPTFVRSTIEILAGPPANMTEVFHDFRQFLQANSQTPFIRPLMLIPHSNSSSYDYDSS
jgi:hypothetical protein